MMMMISTAHELDLIGRRRTETEYQNVVRMCPVCSAAREEMERQLDALAGRLREGDFEDEVESVLIRACLGHIAQGVGLVRLSAVEDAEKYLRSGYRA